MFRCKQVSLYIRAFFTFKTNFSTLLARPTDVYSPHASPAVAAGLLNLRVTTKLWVGVHIREGRQYKFSKIKIPPKMYSSAWSNVLHVLIRQVMLVTVNTKRKHSRANR